MGKKLNGSEANNINDCMQISSIYELQSISTDKTYEPNRFSKFMLAGDIDGTATKDTPNRPPYSAVLLLIYKLLIVYPAPSNTPVKLKSPLLNKVLRRNQSYRRAGWL